jgi:hypothetical protein
VWEYVRIWHRANWTGLRQAKGWDAWVVLPDSIDGPPPDASDSAALNLMGRDGWELVHVDLVWDVFPGANHHTEGAQRPQYYFKRRIDLM